MDPQSFEEDLLRRWFPQNAGETLKPFTESDIREIADVLTRCARERWSRVPRLYSILRKIGQLDTIDAFIDSDVTDVYFPFNKSTLPEALRDHSARLRFLELQHLVYNKEAVSLERHAPHGHFSDPTEVPFKKVGELGKGGFGYVDRVVSTISHKEYARKLISRGRTFKKDKQVLKDFTKELWNLKKLSHKHLVELVGSYTDTRFVAIVMLPVADANLQTFLERRDLDANSRSFLRPFFGCLTSALCYLHDNRIRHKDIKPSNVLIKGDQVYFTDFGTALDWSSYGSSITATAAPTTPRYCAPEVMLYTKRDSSSDIWSLGCVFLEMWTVLKSYTLEDLASHMAAHGSGARGYHSNLEAIRMWIEILKGSSGPPSDLIPSHWIVNMLQKKPIDRWNIHILDNRITEACVDSSVKHVFRGICCLELEEELSDDTFSLTENSEDHSAVRSRPQYAYISTSIRISPVGPDIDRTISTVGIEDNKRSVSPEKTEMSVGSESQSLVHVVGAFEAQEPAERLKDASEDTPISTVINKQASSTSTLVSLRSGVAKKKDYGCLEPDINHCISRDSSSSSNVGAINHSSRSASPSCYWDIASQLETDSEPDDDPSNVVEATGEGVSHLLRRQLNSSKDEAATKFEMHARNCVACNDPLEAFRRHAELCTEGLLSAKCLLETLYKSNGRVYRVIVSKDRPLRTLVAQIDIRPSFGQVGSLLKAIELSKRCSGNYVFLAYYCDDPKHRYWQELYPCPRCKSPLGSHTRQQLTNGKLVHKKCDRLIFINDGTGDGQCENDGKHSPEIHSVSSSITSNNPQRISEYPYRPPSFSGDRTRRVQNISWSKSKKSGFRTPMDVLLKTNSTQITSSKKRKSKRKDGEKRPAASPEPDARLVQGRLSKPQSQPVPDPDNEG
jgi:serine/threonine protein kinase